MGNADSRTDILGLTKQDKKVMNKIWAFLKSDDTTKLGVLLFTAFFTDHPEHRKYFHFVKPTTELSKSATLRLHASRVMKDIATCVENIDAEEVVICAMRRNAIRHRKRMITRKAYDDLRRTFVKVMCNHYLDLFSMEMAETFNKVLRLLFDLITSSNEGAQCSCKPELTAPPPGSASPGSSGKLDEL